VSVLAHVGGFPIEETLATAGPALLVAFGVAWANLRARVHAQRAHNRKLSLRLTARVTDPAGNTRIVKTTAKPNLERLR
jgi:hypothetical protein